MKKTFEDIEYVSFIARTYQVSDLHIRSAFIQGRVQICNDLKQRKLGDEALKGQEEIRNVQKVCPDSLLSCFTLYKWPS